ncbi:MAG: DUF1934 domain-containing protein [Oscillospiraceae bacterium]|jgi:uncharacterized beta-barrel protein YwiB (DUF1934 family)|nr:DUF1934 domain-containing protein [Oscillospiraceae bacterium]
MRIKIESVIDDGTEQQYFNQEESGSITQEGDSVRLVYGDKPTTQLIIASPDKACMFKSGSEAAKMEFIKGERTASVYQTEYFPVEVQLYTSKISCDLNESGGTIRLHYSIFFDAETAHNVKLKITMEAK